MIEIGVGMHLFIAAKRGREEPLVLMPMLPRPDTLYNGDIMARAYNVTLTRSLMLAWMVKLTRLYDLPIDHEKPNASSEKMSRNEPVMRVHAKGFVG